MKKIKSVKDFNWAWQFYDEKKNDWIQFECPECLMLEFGYQIYRMSSSEEHKQTQIMKGLMDFEK